MADVATLGIQIDNSDVPKATASLEGLTVSSAKSEAATQRLTRRMALLEIEARKMDADITRNASTFGRMQASMERAERVVPGLTGALKALSVVAAVGFIGRKTIEETEEAQAAMAQLEAAVSSTGGAAGRTVQQLDELSIALQRQTTYSDEAVKGAEAILLTFNKINGATFDRATRDVTDLAARLGKDLPEAALQVGKALQSPIDGMQALQRLGVRFTDSQKATVKQLVETGHAAQAQAMILDELEKKFGGSAAAARDTLGGALAGLKNTWGDLFEVTRGGSQGTVDGLNAITHSLETSGLSMDKFILNTVVGWKEIVAGVQKFNNMMSFDPTKNWQAETDRIRGLNDKIDLDLASEIARLRSPAKIGPAGGGAPPPNGPTQAELDAIRKQHQANQDMVRDAEQAADLAGLQGAAQERVRILYEAQNKILDAQRRLKGDILQETINAIEEEKRLKLQGVDRAEQLRIQQDAIKNAKQQLDSMEEDFTSKLSRSLSRVFGKDNPLRGMFESLTKDLLGVWISRFVEPAAAAMFSIDMAQFGRGGGLNAISDASHSMAPNPKIAAGAGALIGAGVGYSSANPAFGAIAGGIGAFTMGAGPVGIALAAFSGLASGILGAGHAAREAAKQQELLRQAYKNTQAQIAAQLSGDTLAQKEADIHAQFDAYREQAKKAAGAFAEYMSQQGMDPQLTAQFGNNLNQNLALLNQQEAAFIEQARQADALLRKNAQQDLDVRTLRNKGLSHEADVQAKINQDAREYLAAQQAGMSQAYLDQLKWNQSIEEAAVAAGKASDAMHSLADGLNQVAGYNLARAVFANASPVGIPNTMSTTTGALMPPVSPTDRGGSIASGPPQVIENIIVLDSKVVARSTKQVFMDEAQRVYGDTTRWAET